MKILPPFALTLYFARRYLLWLMMTLLGFVCFLLIVDAVELYRRFSNVSTDYSGTIIIWLLIISLPEKIDLLLPMTVSFGSLFCFHNWSKTNELMVARGFGQNIWQALLPVFITVILLGSLQNLVLNPIKSATIASQNDLKAKIFGNANNGKLSVSASGVWLKDTSSEDDFIIHGPSLSLAEYRINKPIIYGLNQQGNIIWRIKAQAMRLTDKGWVIEEGARSDNLGTTVHRSDMALGTSMKPIDFARTTQTPETISIYALPSFIHMLNQTGLPSNEHKVYFQKQLSNPVLLLGLAMLAACFTLLSYKRMPGSLLIMAGGVISFMVFFITESVFVLGTGFRLPLIVAGWGPAISICLVAGFMLARSEDK